LLSRFPSGFEEREVGARLSFVLYAPDAAAIDRMHADLSIALANYSVQLRAQHKAVDWQSAWLATLGPQPLTERTTVVPVKGPPRLRLSKTAAHKLYLLQRAAFGFGEHPTTRLMADQLERLLTDGKKRSVLDVGAGTGVLGILAALRGAGKVVGIDIDLPSVEAANANAALNGVARRCRFESLPLQRVEERFDIVLANLDFLTLQGLSKSLRRVSRRGTVLLLSGVLSEDVPALATTFEKLGFRLREQRAQEEWVVLEYRL
ncbi:MAG TPA: 50S ribosomal protein L11 methyltransferase, partial [Polyangiaceae bacterium]|nr:50S ribosomal protein L11 methyltransferase [Polyangiaceae bacterium]